MANRSTLWLIGLIGGMMLAGLALTTSPFAFELPWQSVSSGGGRTNSPNFQLQSSVGNGPIGVAGSSGYRVESGYWAGVLQLNTRSIPTPTTVAPSTQTPTTTPTTTPSASPTQPAEPSPTAIPRPTPTPTVRPVVTPSTDKHTHLPLVMRNFSP